MPHTQRQTNSLLGRQDGQMLKMKPRRPLFKTLTSLYSSTKTTRGDRVETVEDFAGNDHHRLTVKYCNIILSMSAHMQQY